MEAISGYRRTLQESLQDHRGVHPIQDEQWKKQLW